MPRKDFTDERVSKKQRKLDKQRQKEGEKAKKQQRKEVRQALNSHSLGWECQDGSKI